MNFIIVDSSTLEDYTESLMQQTVIPKEGMLCGLSTVMGAVLNVTGLVQAFFAPITSCCLITSTSLIGCSCLCFAGAACTCYTVLSNRATVSELENHPQILSTRIDKDGNGIFFYVLKSNFSKEAKIKVCNELFELQVLPLFAKESYGNFAKETKRFFESKNRTITMLNLN